MRQYGIVLALVACAVSTASGQGGGRQAPAGNPQPGCMVNGVRVDAAQCRPGVPMPGLAPSPAPDPFARFLYPPELIMGHTQAIGLTSSQLATITAAMLDAQKTFIDAQFKMSAEVEKLQSLLKSPSVDQSAALAQVDRVLALERAVKHAQLGLMIEIKNTLSADQQAMLDKLRTPGAGEQ